MTNLYAQDWDDYARSWKASNHLNAGAQLGDEWWDREQDQFHFDVYCDRLLQAGATVLEVGPGGGKFTFRMQPKAGQIWALDVSSEMLALVDARAAEQGVTNIKTVLSDGTSFAPIESSSIDFFFSFDVFVHLDLPTTMTYIMEMARVLGDDAIGVCHHAVSDGEQALASMERQRVWYLDATHTLGKFYYYGIETLRWLYERNGLRVFEVHQEGPGCTFIFRRKPRSI